MLLVYDYLVLLSTTFLISFTKFIYANDFKVFGGECEIRTHGTC